MTLRKITIDNSVRYIPITEKPKEKEVKPKTIKAGSLPRKQNKKPSQNKKKDSLKKFQHQDLLNSQTNVHMNIHI